MFIAPIIDSKFSNKIGKSKTYILICGIMNSFLIMFLSFKVEGFIHSLNIKAIFLYLLPINILMAFQDAATDAWVLTILGKEKQKGGLALLFGYSGGFWAGYPLFSVLNTMSYITNQRFLQLFSVYMLCCTVLVTLFVAEEKMESGIKS